MFPDFLRDELKSIVCYCFYSKERDMSENHCEDNRKEITIIIILFYNLFAKYIYCGYEIHDTEAKDRIFERIKDVFLHRSHAKP